MLIELVHGKITAIELQLRALITLVITEDCRTVINSAATPAQMGFPLPYPGEFLPSSAEYSINYLMSELSLRVKMLSTLEA